MFKLEVTSPFTDMNTGEVYKAGDVIELDNRARVVNIINQGLATLVSATCWGKAKKHGKKILIHQTLCYVVGGIETANYNFASTFRDRDITFIFGSADIDQVIRLTEFANVIIDDYTSEYECDILLLANYDSGPKILDRVKARKIYQEIHADFYNLTKMPQWRTFELNLDKRIDKILAVSETAQNGLKRAFELDSIIAPNILAPKEENATKVFLTLSRGSAEKGIETIVEMARRFKAAGKSFYWILATTTAQVSIDTRNALRSIPEIIMIKPSIKASAFIDKADYLVQLSKNESYCYSLHEALQSGTAVISTRIPEAEKLIKEGINGYLVDTKLGDLDIEKIFNKVPRPAPSEEKVDPIWSQVLDGKV